YGRECREYLTKMWRKAPAFRHGDISRPCSPTFSCIRCLLAQKQEHYKETGKAPTRFQQDKALTSMKQELPWLKEADSTSLQAALQDLDAAFQNFFRRVKKGEK